MEEASAVGNLERAEEIFEMLLITRMEGLSLERPTMPGSALVLELSLAQTARDGHTEFASHVFGAKGSRLPAA